MKCTEYIVARVSLPATVFMAPETAMQPQWRAVVSKEPFQHQLAMVAIDEAHCVVEWLVSGVTNSQTGS